LSEPMFQFCDLDDHLWRGEPVVCMDHSPEIHDCFCQQEQLIRLLQGQPLFHPQGALEMAKHPSQVLPIEALAPKRSSLVCVRISAIHLHPDDLAGMIYAPSFTERAAFFSVTKTEQALPGPARVALQVVSVQVQWEGIAVQPRAPSCSKFRNRSLSSSSLR